METYALWIIVVLTQATLLDFSSPHNRRPKEEEKTDEPNLDNDYGHRFRYYLTNVHSAGKAIRGIGSIYVVKIYTSYSMQKGHLENLFILFSNF